MPTKIDVNCNIVFNYADHVNGDNEFIDKFINRINDISDDSKIELSFKGVYNIMDSVPNTQFRKFIDAVCSKIDVDEFAKKVRITNTENYAVQSTILSNIVRKHEEKHSKIINEMLK